MKSAFLESDGLPFRFGLGAYPFQFGFGASRAGRRVCSKEIDDVESANQVSKCCCQTNQLFVIRIG